MYRTSIPTFVMVAVVSLACGWAAPARGGLVAGEPIRLMVPGAPRELRIRSVTVSPDGTKIAFSVFGPLEWQGIFMINVDGTNFVRLIDNIDSPWPPTGPGSRDDVIRENWFAPLAWSPDGTKLAFKRSVSVPSRLGPWIYVMNVDGTNLVRLPVHPDSVQIPFSDLRWLPDGRIAFGTYRYPSYRFYAINADGTNIVQLDQLVEVDLGRFEDDADVIFRELSPDRTRIAFMLLRGGSPYTIETLVMNVDGTNLVRLVEEGEFLSSSFAWSPDGTKITYSYGGDIYVVNSDGTTPPVNLTRSIKINTSSGPAIYSGDTSWSPDGTWIASTYRENAHSNTNRISIISLTTETERGDRRATLLNLSPWQAWVHLYCLKDRAGPDADPPAPCAVTFECNGQSGEPVAWPVEVGPKTIFSYWPNKTVDGLSADLQAALIAAGKPEEEARRRTTCEVFSPDPLTVRGYTLFGGQPTLVPVAEPARPAVAAEPGERRRQATLPNLSPWQAWVHLYCLKDRAGPDADPPAPCAVTFECNGQSGEPVTWPVEVAAKTIFSYWPNKTVGGLSADLQAALIAAGKPEEEARRRTTCEVSSADPIAVRGYTRFGGQPTLVPVTAY